jgi:Mrp family chromosome partitioning ATPase
LLHEFPPGQSAVLLLCDPEPAELSPVAAPLAVAMASEVTGQLLVVDGTLRDAGLSRVLAAKTDPDEELRPGFADVLAGRAAWQQAVRPTRLPNLEVLPTPVRETGLEVEPSCPPADRWAAVFRQLRKQYQFVLVTVSPGDNPAARAIARSADATYLLIRPGHTGRRTARRTAAVLRQGGGRVLGCLLVAP